MFVLHKITNFMKRLIIAVSILTMSYTANSQGFYIDLNAGYGIGNPSSVIGIEKYVDKTIGSNDSYEKNIYGSLGKGINISLNPGYMITKNIGVELGFNYFLGSKTVMNKETNIDPDIFDKTSAISNQVRVIPSVVINTGGDKLYGYAKAGVVLPVAGSTKGTREVSFTSEYLGNKDIFTTTVETTTKGSLSLGFRGALGIGYNFNNWIGINLDIFATVLNVKAKTRKFDSFVSAKNGVVDDSPSTVYSTEINYVDQLTTSSNNKDFNSKNNPNYDDNNAFDKDKPQDVLATKTNFNQFGFSLGVKFRIPSKSK